MSLPDIQKRNLELRAQFSGLDFASSDGTKAIGEGLENIKHEA
jgi:hypothetical protein